MQRGFDRLSPNGEESSAARTATTTVPSLAQLPRHRLHPRLVDHLPDARALELMLLGLQGDLVRGD